MPADLNTYLMRFAMFIIPMLFAITLHEAAHAYIAKLRGDKTAYLMGRVTLNPIKHIDILGTIILPTAMFLLSTGFLFGWAKPVPVNFNNLKKPRQDMILVAIAGPLANFIMAIIWFLLWKFVPNFGFHQMAQFGVILNLMLMVFNLLPIPPLDGSRVISALLPYKAALQYNRLERWGFLIVLLLLFIPFGQSNLLASILLPLINKLSLLIQFIF
ncbi:site-2 protease family protein [Cysteiniphilum sp. QT6929]|uniref:site-2 protease family protein n=1 Tax=Cysteiniphilum sp. QT6929 TaxID=2975055 RepID=UPI0024B362CD|nr:site-2 protease family protein [Cysteiniphilum sp. QT6929]WHN64721.1 site-2 protease family protein [Cysteiniphilum sp. QT6929]